MGAIDTLRRLVGGGSLRRAVVKIMPAAVRQSFLAKLLVTVAVTVIVGSAIGAFFFFGISGTLNEQVDRTVRSSAALQTNVYGDWIRNRREQLVATSQRSFITDDDSQYISDQLANAQARSSAISDYHLIDGETGRIVGSSEQGAAGQNFYTAINASRSVIRSSSRFVLPNQYRTFGDEPVLLFQFPTSYTDRVLIAEVDPDRAPDVLQTFEGSTTYVVTENGSVLVGPESLSFVPSTAPRAPVVTRTNGSLYTHQRIPGTRLTLVTQTPTESAFAVREDVLLSFVLTLVLIFGVITVVGLYSGDAAIRELTRLADKSREMAAGNLDVDLSTNREDEIGTLYTSFQEMRDALWQRITEAESAQARAQTARAELVERNEEVEEQRAIISVLNRVLRHNLRNDLTVVRTHLDFVRRHSDADVERDHISVIDQKVGELVERADKAREIEQLTRKGHRSLVEVDVSDVIEGEVDRFHELYPSVTIEFDADDVSIAHAHESIAFVVVNLIENAIEHNDSDDPLVSITVTPVDEWIEIRVADNGPGIPEGELSSLHEGYETAIEHGSGLGLWLVNWLVDEMNGELQFTDREPRGTVVTIRLRQADSAPNQQQAALDHD